MLTEFKDLRERYGNDKRAINRHSTRYYQHSNGGFVMIDRILDISPPCFELLDLLHDPRKPSETCYIPTTIKIGDNRFFGDGMSWNQAEQLADKRLEEFCEA